MELSHITLDNEYSPTCRTSSYCPCCSVGAHSSASPAAAARPCLTCLSSSVPCRHHSLVPACPHLSACCLSLPVLICPPVAAPAAVRPCLTCLSSSVPCRRHSLVPVCPHLSACCCSACCSSLPVLICPPVAAPPAARPCLTCLSSSVPCRHHISALPVSPVPARVVYGPPPPSGVEVRWSGIQPTVSQTSDRPRSRGL